MKNLSGRVARAIPWALLESSVVSMVGLISTAVLARLLPARDFGVAALAFSLTAFVELALSALFVDTLIQRRPLRRAHIETAFWTVSGAGAVALAVLALAAPWLARWYDDPRLIWLMPLACLATFFVVMSVLPSIVLTRRLKVRETALRNAAVRLTGIAIAVSLALAGAGVWSLFASALAANAVGCWMLWRSYGKRPQRMYELRALRELLAFGIPAAAENLVWQLGLRGFNALVGYLHGVAALGYLSLAMRLTEAVTTLFTSFTGRLALPLFAALHAERERLRAAFLRASHLLAATITPIYGLIAMQADDVVSVVFGPRWDAAAPLLALLSVSELALLLRQLVTPMLRAMQRPAPLLPAAVGALVVMLVVVALSAHASVLEATWGWAARPLIVLPVGFVLMTKIANVGLTGQLRALAVPLWGLLALCSVAIAFQHWLAQAPALLRLTIVSSSAAAAYAALLWVADAGRTRRELLVVARQALRR